MNPTYIDVSEYSPADAECVASSPSPVTYQWTRLDGQLSPDADVSNGLLRFNVIRRSDVGDYQCHARNEYGDDTRILRVYVRDLNPQPQPQPQPQPPPQPEPQPQPQPQPSQDISIQPPNFSGRPGDVVILNCHNLVNVYATLIWSKEGLHQLPSHINARDGVLTIHSATVEDTGRYTCTSEPSQAQPHPINEVADVFITSNNNQRDPPKIRPLNELYTVIQGHDFSLVCEASGSPHPIVKWKKIHDELGSNVQQNGNILRILNAQPDNRGVYICSADSDGLSAEQSTVIDIERKFLCNFYLRFVFLDLLT